MSGLTERIGLGVTLGVMLGSSSTNLAGVIDGIDGPDATAPTVPLTLLADTFETFAKGQVDPGTLTLDVAYDPAESTGSLLSSMMSVVNQPPYSFYITYPAIGATSAATQTFSAHVTGLGLSIKKDEKILRKLTLKLSGDPGFGGG